MTKTKLRSTLKHTLASHDFVVGVNDTDDGVSCTVNTHLGPMRMTCDYGGGLFTLFRRFTNEQFDFDKFNNTIRDHCRINPHTKKRNLHTKDHDDYIYELEEMLESIKHELTK